MSETTSQKPYIGLIPFHEQDAEFFFGREQEREIITSNLMASRLTLLYGASGVGKSSVLHAGVAHHLRALARRDIKRRGKPKFTVVIFSAWRDEPIKSLLGHVQKAVIETLEGQHVEPVSPDLPFVDSLREWSRRVQGQLLIILDQFEEYFLYHPNEDGEGTFAVEFPRAVLTPGLPANFIVSYREDAHAKLDFFKGRIPNLYENYLRIGHLGYEAARAAIEKPVERFNNLNQLDQQHSFHIKEELIAAVLSQVRAGEKYIGDSGKGIVGDRATEDEKWEVETPYLQLVMTRLWDKEVKNGSRVLRLETLEQLGGAKHIVQTHLDNAMGQLSAKEQLMGANIFNYLVTPSGTKIAQTAHDLADYANLSKDKEKQLDQMMEKLTAGDQRILRSVPPPANQPKASRYEVFHDVLAQAILDWRRRYLARKATTRLLRIVGVMALIVLFMGAVAAFAVQQARAARTAEAQAENNRLLAERQAEVARMAENQAVESQKRAEMSEERTRVEATKNKELAVENKELANKFQRAFESERIAKSQADQERQRAVSAAIKAKAATDEARKQKDNADAAAKVAEEERLKAEVAAKKAQEALATVEEIDASNAYYKTVMRPGSNVSEASFSANGQRALTVSDDGVARIWDVNSQKKPNEPTLELRSDAGVINHASFSPDGRFVITVANEKQSLAGKATVWDVSGEAASEVGRFSITDKKGNQVLLFGAGFSANGGTVVAYGANEAEVCELDSASKLKDCRTLALPPNPNLTVDFVETVSTDGRFLVTLTPTEIDLWSTQSGKKTKLAHPVAAGSSLVGTFVTFTPNGRFVATASPLDGAHLFDVETGALVGTLSVSAGVAKLAFSPNGNLVVIGRADGSATVLETMSRREVFTFRGHTAALTDVAFSPDGNYVVTASGDKTARVWDVSDGKLFAELRGHIGSVNSAAFTRSEEGTFVLTSGDKTARVWDVTRRTDSGIAQGEVGINNNGTFDLDSGSRNPIPILGVSGADLSWRFYEKIDGTTRSISWNLNPENRAQIALFSDGKGDGGPSSGNRKFEDISVTELIGLNYSSTGIAGAAIDQNPVPGNDTLALSSIFAVRTSDGNYAKVQVLERSTILKIRWVTYKNPGPRQSSPQLSLKSWTFKPDVRLLRQGSINLPDEKRMCLWREHIRTYDTGFQVANRNDHILVQSKAR